MGWQNREAVLPPIMQNVRVQYSLDNSWSTLPRYEKVKVISLGLFLSCISFLYGAHALIHEHIYLVGRGSPPWGTIVEFQGLNAQLLSTIFLGAGIGLFGSWFLKKIGNYKVGTVLSRAGVAILLFGMGSLVVIFASVLF